LSVMRGNNSSVFQGESWRRLGLFMESHGSHWPYQ
jgi:hypothetical protein